MTPKPSDTATPRLLRADATLALDQTETACDWFDTKEQRWRTLDQQVEEDLKLREAQQLLDYHARRYDY